jgi:hypothetical protein
MNKNYAKIILIFLKITSQIKLYHWQTKLYARHIATDTLLSELSILIDSFVEILQGRLIIESKDPNFRILLENNNKIIIDDYNDEQGNKFIISVKEYLENTVLIENISSMPELLNIKDEMLGLVNKIAFLFSLN